MIAAADPNGPANMLATGLFWTAGIAALVGIGKAFDAFTASRLHRHVTRALDHGDEQILRAVTEHEAAFAQRRHVSVPEQLERTRRP